MPFTIRQARTYRGKTQLETAQALGVSEATYRRYEGSPADMPAGVLDRFSRVVNIPIQDISIRREEEEGEE